MAELFLNYKAHIEAKNKNNQTPRSNIAKTSKKAITQVLLKDKAEIKARDKNEKTILHLAGATRIFFP